MVVYESICVNNLFYPNISERETQNVMDVLKTRKSGQVLFELLIQICRTFLQ